MKPEELSPEDQEAWRIFIRDEAIKAFNGAGASFASAVKKAVDRGLSRNSDVLERETEQVRRGFRVMDLGKVSPE